MSGKAWTNHEVEKLKQLHAMGMSTYEIAQGLGRTHSSIESRCNDLMSAGEIGRRTRMQRIKINQRARARSDAERYRQVCAP
jgi:hypothetical protein